MPTYELNDGSNTVLTAAQLKIQNPNSSWDWSIPLSVDMASHLNVIIIPDPVPTPPTLTIMQLALANSAENQRLFVQSQGVNYTFPDSTGTIQTRDPNQYPDIANINGQATAALILQAQGITTAVMFFRDLQNVTHPLTPTQTIAMAMAVNKWVGDLYTYKWNMVSQIQALTTIETAQAFDVTQGWPTS